MLQIYNTLTKSKALFQPVNGKQVNMYVCGMTVYDYCHIGHARTYVSFDIIRRYLAYSGYKVNYVRNITDIDDKIIKRAKENHEDFQTLTSRMIKFIEEDEKALNILPPDHAPRATAYIPQMIKMIDTLIQKKLAYVASNGDVYYAVQQFTSYGKLAHKNMEKLRAGARVSVVEAKIDPLDFVLWKLAKPDEPSWDSPWGKGRPGWHIECSAMALDCLGEQLDIHGGGFDLIFPHHQNEIAQSEGLTNKTFANLWMHAGFVTVNKEKMSKSLNNFFTVREVLKRYSPEVLRYFLMTSHYRSQLHYAAESLDQAQTALERLYLTLRDVPPGEHTENHFSQRFHDAMQDDFNMPVALSVLFDLARESNKSRDAKLSGTLKYLGSILGILAQAPEVFLKQQLNNPAISEAEIEALIQQRTRARQEKSWALADKIRDELHQKGVVIEDSSGETQWRRLTVANTEIE
jgi:cysteinyl-tRNA synthetase